MERLFCLWRISIWYIPFSLSPAMSICTAPRCAYMICPVASCKFFSRQIDIIDEVQKAPQLFEQIKIMCDESEEKGRFWLTGSRQFSMMKNIRDTLAGRYYAYAKAKSNLTYYRDSNAKEIDVFVEENNQIHPLEIKKSANPDRREVKKYALVDKTTLERGSGGIVCMCEDVLPIDDKNCFIPCNLI